MSAYLTVYHQSVKLETTDSRLISLVERFLRDNYTSVSKGFGANAEPIVTTYVSKIENYSIWYMLTNQFKHFMYYLKTERAMDLMKPEIEDQRSLPTVKVDMKVRDGWVLRDEQKPVYDFVTDGDSKVKLVPLATGSGKTAVSLIALAGRSERIAVIIPPQFMSKWSSDIQEIHEADESDIMTIQGGKSIIGVIDLAKTNKLKAKYIIFSSRTLQEYVKNFEQNPEEVVDIYGGAPTDLLPMLGVGSVLIDETHMTFHAIFRVMTHMNVPFHLGLSATLMSEDNVVRRAHKAMYPSKTTYGETLQKQYMDVYPVEYTIGPVNSKNVKTTQRGSTFYSHTAFEMSIIKNPKIFDSYYRIIKDCIDEHYVQDYKEGDKLVIFVSMIKMADMLIERIERDYDNRIVFRYCMGDSYDEMLKSEIIVSTIGSLGTGVDVPMLRTVLQTVSISSPVSNIQSAGRLRYLPDRDVRLCYIFASNVPKHIEYHQKRLLVLKDRTKSVVLRKSSYNL